MIMRGDQHASNITTAVTKFQDAIKRFDCEARICDAKRLGNVEHHVIQSRGTLENLQRRIQGKFIE